MVKRIKANEAYRVCDLSKLDFKNTDELDELREIIGQDRALESIKISTKIKHDGYNLFVMSNSGSNLFEIVDSVLKNNNLETKLYDWCYVNNFEDTRKPIALKLQAGDAPLFSKAIEKLLEELENDIPTTFESEEYRVKKKVIDDKISNKISKLYKEIEQVAKKRNIALLNTSKGIVFAPFDENGKVMDPKKYEELPEEIKKKINEEMQILGSELQEVSNEVAQIKRDGVEEIKELDKKVTDKVISKAMKNLISKYKNNEKVMAYLNDLREDIVKNVKAFLNKNEMPLQIGNNNIPASVLFRKYEVNILVTHEKEIKTPIIYEDNPIYQNLIGSIEHIAYMGTLVTDFNLIKSGAFHRANGGYLVLDVRKLLMQPFSWEAIKRVLFAKKINIEAVEKMYSFANTLSLEPEPIPIDLKVILLGDRYLYYLLYQLDNDFSKLFKIVADLEDNINNLDENRVLYAKLIASLVKKHSLLPFDKSAVAKVIEHGSRLAEDSTKISLERGDLKNLLIESDFTAKERGAKIVTREDVKKTIDMQKNRLSRIYNQIIETIKRDIIKLELYGLKIGEINGLSVIDLGDFSFGKPVKISAKTRLGKGEIIDIEREVDLSGSIHSKGIMILESFLGARYAKNTPLYLSARLVFEQSYSGVDGDSASLAELCAILSSLAEVPIKQNFAVTGSINQSGVVQAIGGVNEKIEGFFDVCKAKGIDSDMNIIIPKSNVEHLMLKEEVINEIKEGNFNIYPVSSVDEALFLLTDVKVGKRNKKGHFPKDSINDRVLFKLESFAKKVAELNGKS